MKGETGDQGPKGEIGDQGQLGDVGQIGDQGPKGRRLLLTRFYTSYKVRCIISRRTRFSGSRFVKIFYSRRFHTVPFAFYSSGPSRRERPEG